MLSEPRITRLKHLKGYYIDEDYIRNFEKEWDAARNMVINGMERYEKLYTTNKDFKDYVDNYMKNKNVTLSQVLSLKITQLIADDYERRAREDSNNRTD